MQEKTTYTITLEAERATDQGEAARALRAALKCLLRAFGLRCVRLGESTPYAKLLESGDGTPVGRENEAG